MGGAGSGVTDATTRILLEAAQFLPMAIARTSKRLRLRSEASARFERGVDIEGIDRAADRYCALVGAEVAAGTLDVRAHAPEERRARLRVDRLNAVLGSDLSPEDVTGYLDPIGFSSTPVDDADLDVAIPSWRPDVEAEIDVIEEVARHHGFSRLGAAPLVGARTGGLTPHQRLRREVRSALLGAGVSEAATSPLIGPDDHKRTGYPGPVIAASNPMMQEESILRATLLPGLLRSVAYNASHRNPAAWLFELGKVFRPTTGDTELPDETERLTAVFAGSESPQAVRAWRALASGLRLADLSLEPTIAAGLHPHRTACIFSAGQELGFVGEVHPDVLNAWEIPGRVAVVDVDFELLVSAARRSLEQQPVSRFPSSDIDLAFEIPDGISAEKVEVVIRRAGGDDLRRVELFDVYRGEQMGAEARGLAFRLRFQAADRTLTDAEVATYRVAIIGAVESDLGGTLRG